MDEGRTHTQELETSGRLWLRNVVSDADLALFDAATAHGPKPGRRIGTSNALTRALSPDTSLLRALHRLDPAAKPVRVVAFNKSDGANWGVPWHQDRVIAVRGRANVDGYKNWSQKSGVWHCEPPHSVLDGMLFVRVHLDDTDAANGAMEIAPGSHARGIIPAAQAEAVAQQYPQEICTARRGDVLVLKMLTLHASKPAQIQTGRRVLRVDFASSPLPAPLSWQGIG